MREIWSVPIRIRIGWTWQIRIRAGVESHGLDASIRTNVPVSVGFHPAVIPSIGFLALGFLSPGFFRTSSGSLWFPGLSQFAPALIVPGLYQRLPFVRGSLKDLADNFR